MYGNEIEHGMFLYFEPPDRMFFHVYISSLLMLFRDFLPFS